MKIKFTRSVLHKGEHQEQGSVIDLPKPEALFFVTTGDAIEVAEKENAASK